MKKFNRIYIIVSSFLVLSLISVVSAEQRRTPPTKSKSHEIVQPDVIRIGNTAESIQLGKTIPWWPSWPCGPIGSSVCYSVGGTVSGLNGTVTLQKNGVNPLPISSNGPFTFPSLQYNGSPYSVIPIQHPVNQTCNVINGQGSINSAHVNNILVNCETCWESTNTVGAPSPRQNHIGIWTGTEMIIWGGDNFGNLSDGARYNPMTNSWTPVSSMGPNWGYSAVWTGTEMIIWGSGSTYSNIYSYTPATNSWATTSIVTGFPSVLFESEVWTGSEIIYWNGNAGARYNPITHVWTPISSVGAPSLRLNYSAVWTGSEMIVWGGSDSSGYPNDGGRYNPMTDTWTPMTSTNAPVGRIVHSTVWTGSEMIVWGGVNPGPLNDGAIYNPTTNSWTTITMTNAPSARYSHSAVWTGSEMIIWAGLGPLNNTGSRYNPVTDTWTPICAGGVPSARHNHSAVWTGSQMIVWGGRQWSQNSILGDGGRFNP